MAELIEIGEQQERVILFAASTNASDDTEESVEELRELVKTAGAETVGAVIQNRENIHPGTYLGKGKIQELKEMVWESGATGVVCDDELSPAQLKNLEDALDTKVMDRTMIILDIFAATYNPLPCYYISAIIYLTLNIVLGKGLDLFERRMKCSDR